MRRGTTGEGLGPCKVDMPDGLYALPIANGYRVILRDGRYAVTRAGERAAIQIKRPKKGFHAGCVLLLLRFDMGSFRAIGTLRKDGSVQFFLAFEANNAKFLDRIRSVVSEVAQTTEKARSFYEEVQPNLVGHYNKRRIAAREKLNGKPQDETGTAGIGDRS
jgi:hypothetical protein